MYLNIHSLYSAFTHKTLHTSTHNPATKDEACAAAKRNKDTAHTDGKYTPSHSHKPSGGLSVWEAYISVSVHSVWLILAVWQQCCYSYMGPLKACFH